MSEDRSLAPLNRSSLPIARMRAVYRLQATKLGKLILTK